MAIDLEQKIWKGLRDFEKIPELDFTPKSFFHEEYAVATIEEVLGPVIEDNDVGAAAGSYFGDESKGKKIKAVSKYVVLRYALNFIVVRLNSGSNAGHTNIFNDEKVVLHLIPSGIFEEGVINYIGSECVMDPLEFMGEIDKLIEHNIDYKERLFVGNVYIVTPYHKLMDVVRNIKSIDESGKVILGNVSTLKGMAPVHGSKAWKNGPRLDELFGEESKFRKRLEKDMQTYFGMLHTRGISEEKLFEICEEINSDMKRIPDYIINFLKAEDKALYLIDMYKHAVRENDLFPERRHVKWEIQEALRKGKKILVECPQAYFLSNAEGTHHRTATSADTTLNGILACSGINITKYKIVAWNVHKAPISSRIGGGVNPPGFTNQTYFSDKGIRTLNDLDKKTCADFDAIQKQFWESIGENGVLEPTGYTDETGETYLVGEAMAIASVREYGEHGATTLKPRMTGLFDCVAHAVVMREQGPYTVISAVDRGDILDNVGVVIAYVYYNPEGKISDSYGIKYNNGDIIRPGDPYPTEDVLAHCRPIIKLIDGWKDSPIAAEKWDGKTLPRGVQMFMETIEYFTGAEIIAIGNGPEDKNMIYIKKIPLAVEEGDIPRPEDLGKHL